MIREDPPTGGAHQGDHWDIAGKLKADPRNWYRIVEDSTTVQQATNINKARYAAYRPEGSFQATSRKDKTTGRYTVWARYVGEKGE